MKRRNLSNRLRVVEDGGVTFGDVVYGAGEGFGPRWQADFQLVLIVTGSARIAVSGIERVVRAGEVTLLRPGREESFAWDAAGRTRHTWCAVAPAVVAGDERLGAALAAVTEEVRPVSARLAQIMEAGLGIVSGTAEATGGLVAALGRAALAGYAASAGGLGTTSGAGLRPVAQLLDWLGEHGAEPVDLATLAKVAGVSAAQLVRVCKRELGETPLRYVWRVRTTRGVQLLRDTGLTVGEIAWRCGFQTPFHFSRWVRALEGVGPREVRRGAWRRGEERGGKGVG